MALTLISSSVDPNGAADPSSEVSSAVATLPHGAGLSSVDAWPLVQSGAVVLVDVRTHEERTFVGHVPDSVHVPWATGTALTRNPRFIRELEAKVGKSARVILMCRSGKRSALALDAALKAGFEQIAHITDGFEGDLDASGQRGHQNGWRYHRLPWIQG